MPSGNSVLVLFPRHITPAGTKPCPEEVAASVEKLGRRLTPNTPVAGEPGAGQPAFVVRPGAALPCVVAGQRPCVAGKRLLSGQPWPLGLGQGLGIWVDPVTIPVNACLGHACTCSMATCILRTREHDEALNHAPVSRLAVVFLIDGSGSVNAGGHRTSVFVAFLAWPGTACS